MAYKVIDFYPADIKKITESPILKALQACVGRKL